MVPSLQGVSEDGGGGRRVEFPCQCGGAYSDAIWLAPSMFRRGKFNSLNSSAIQATTGLSMPNCVHYNSNFFRRTRDLFGGAVFFATK